MIKILVISAQTDLQPYLSGTHNPRAEIRVDYCRNLDSAMKKISEAGGYQIIFADATFISRSNSIYINQLIVQNAVSKIILIFDQPDIQRIRTYMNMGVYDFLLRPISGEDVRATLNKVLREIEMLADVLNQHDHLVSIEQELEIARSIQKSLLRREYPYFPASKGFDVYGQLVSSREVGGDFFDVFMLDTDRLGIVLGDVSGKGLPAALEMARIKVTLQALAVQTGSVDDCLTALNAGMFSDQKPEMPVAVFYAVLNTSSGELSYCNAGVSGSYYLRRHKVFRSLDDTLNPRLGVQPNTVYRSQTIKIAAGESLVLFSDGLVSALGQELASCFGLLQSGNGPLTDPAASKAVGDIIKRANRFPTADDLTCLFLKYMATHDA